MTFCPFTVEFVILITVSLISFYCHEKGRWNFSHADGEGVGGTTSFGVDFAQELEVLATMKGGAQMYSCFESGEVKIFTLS